MTNYTPLKPLQPRVECKDGTSLSVQASEFHYSSPRTNDGPYQLVEVGFIRDPKTKPLSPPRSWKKYADGDFPNDVYAWVPVALVEKFIKKHGGRK